MRSDGELSALRDILHNISLAQHYEDVAANRVWDTVQLALPPPRAVVEQELPAP
jgi:hypothetical protein